MNKPSVIILSTALFLLLLNHGYSAYAQTTTPAPTPTVSTGLDAITLGAAGITLGKQFLDQRKNRKEDKGTDSDVGNFVIIINKIFQLAYLYPNLSFKQILDLPFTNNPMDKRTVGNALTEEANGWAVFNQQYWGLATPQMSVPTTTTLNAIESIKPSSAVTGQGQQPKT